MSKIITSRLILNPTAGVGTFVVPLLGDPGEKRAYRLLAFGATGVITGASGVDGVMIALQDGEIEPGLLSGDEAGRGQVFAAPDGMFNDELSVIWSLALSSTGSGNGWLSPQKNFGGRGFLTANPVRILFHVRAVSAKRLLVHLEYEQESVSPADWVELKHRSTVVDFVFGVDS